MCRTLNVVTRMSLIVVRMTSFGLLPSGKLAFSFLNIAYKVSELIFEQRFIISCAVPLAFQGYNNYIELGSYKSV